MLDRIVAVVGLGYVGLPLACSFASTGLRTIGYDIVAAKTDKIDRGVNPIEGDEPGLSDLLSEVHVKGCCVPPRTLGRLKRRTLSSCA